MKNKFLENNNISKLESGLNQMITSSSYLDLSTKEKLQKYFRTEIVDRYSNQENGLLAHAVGVSHVFSVNYANYFIEILDPITFDHVKPGEIWLIVVTDLYNYGMPLLRYNTRDLARLKEYNKFVGVTSFDQLQGRIVNTLRLLDGV